MKTSLRTKMENSKYSFAQNFWYHLIAPAFIVVLALILGLCFNFNLGLDFRGGTVATVVVEEDLSVDKNYNDVKTKLDKVLSDNNIDGLVYQVESTDYYGYAIVVRFNRIDDSLRDTLRQDLIETFHSTTPENDLERFVKVDNFNDNVDPSIITSTLLAVLVAVVAIMIYLWLRQGTTAGFLSLFMALFDLIVTTCMVIVVRIPVEISSIIAMAFVAIYSGVFTCMFVTDANNDIKQEKHAKASLKDIANITVKKSMLQKLSITLIMLVFVLLLGVIPTNEVRSLTLPCLIGTIVVFLSTTFVTPGLWTLIYIKRRTTKPAKQSKPVVEEVKLFEDEITKEPEVIVETEEKENISKNSVK